MKTIHRNTSDILSSTKLRELNTNQQGQLIVGARTDILGATGSEPNTHTHTLLLTDRHMNTHTVCDVSSTPAGLDSLTAGSSKILRAVLDARMRVVFRLGG